jgi:hypothetical protein
VRLGILLAIMGASLLWAAAWSRVDPLPSLPPRTNATPVSAPTPAPTPTPSFPPFVGKPISGAVNVTNLETLTICDGAVRRWSCETGSEIGPMSGR